MDLKNVNKVALGAACAALVGLIFLIIGISSDWVTMRIQGIGFGFNLGDLADFSDGYKSTAGFSPAYYDEMNAYIYIALVMGIFATIAIFVSLFYKHKAVKPVTLLLAGLTVLFAVLAVVYTFLFCNSDEFKLVAQQMDFACTPNTGVWMLVIGAILNAGACAFALLSPKAQQAPVAEAAPAAEATPAAEVAPAAEPEEEKTDAE